MASGANSNFLDQHYDSDESEDFNPAQADVSDDEGQDGQRGSSVNGGQGQESDAEQPVRQSAGKTIARPQVDGADDDDDEEAANDDEDEEDEEDEDDEEEEEVGHRRKRRRERRNQFLDVEAEVDESEDENDDDEDELNELKDGFIAETHPDDDDLPAGRDIDDRRHRELDRRREMEASMDAEKQAEILRQRYAKTRKSNYGAADTAVPKRLLLPSVDDPSIWAVKCKEGKEREVIFSITKRIEERLGTKDQLAITSAFERANSNAPIRGYIYVEAQRQADIEKALDGMLNVYPRTKMQLVEIKEMPDLLRVKKSDPLEPGSYVRLKRPVKYAGDLAQIIDVTENGLEVRVRFVPRLDYGAHEDLQGNQLDAQGKRKRPTAGPRPPPRLFSEVEAKRRHARYLTGNPQTKVWQYMGDEYVNGFCEKDVKIQLLQTKEVNPTLEEVSRFATGGENGVENLDLKALASSLKDSTASSTYLPGDIVEIYEGEQKGVAGKVINIHGDIVTMNVTDGDLRGQTIEVPQKGLRKRFRQGDHVKVIGGSRYRDEVGMVVKISQDRVTLLTDQDNREVTVFSKDLRESSDSGGAGSLGQFELWDLVQLDPTTVACIIKIDRESLIVLDQNEQVRTLLPSQISQKIGRRRFGVATDRDGSEIRVDDIVREVGDGGRQGKITHIHRSFLFMHSPEITEHAGIFVTRTTNVQTIAAKGGRIATGNAVDLTSMNPALKLNPNGDAVAMPPPKFMGRDRTIGQTCTVKKGVYKGLLGIVKEATDTHARVELHTKGKTISVLKDFLAFKDQRTGQTIDPNVRGGYRGAATPRGGGSGYGGRSSYGGATPGGGTGHTANSWNRTPQNDGRTPAWGKQEGGRTPAWQSGGGGRTPAWQSGGNDGSRTSYGGNNGGQTAYGGATTYGGATSYGGGARTPAWSAAAGSKTPAYGADSGSKTPYGGGSGSGDAWGGSKTPAFGAHGGADDGPVDAPTPAFGAVSAPTPGAFTAPTPAANGSAPTPGAWGGAGDAWEAKTPGGVGAATPGAWAAETPAAWGDDDGPKYDDE